MDPEPTSPADAAVSSSSRPEDVAATYCATLLDEWVALGLTDLVASPGSRSTPVALAAAADERIRVHVHHDERSASFMALGLAAVTGRPAALLCTSGTAAVQFHAAVVEAHHSCVPMLVLTADRPPELRGVGAPQTIDQRELYGPAARAYLDPGPPEPEASGEWRGLAERAWRIATGTRPGPVQLNLAFREPLVGTPCALPPPRADAPAAAAPLGLTAAELDRLAGEMESSRGVIVAGVRSARCSDDAAAVQHLAAHLGWPLIADAPSGCRSPAPGSVLHADALLRVEGFASSHRPEVVLRIGGLLTSRSLNRWLAASDAFQVGLDRHGEVPDPDDVISVTVPGDVATVCDQLRGAMDARADLDWLDDWIRADRIAGGAIARVLTKHSEATEPAAAIDLANLLTDDGVLVVSSSMPVRDLENFAPARPGVQVIANRGASGIDGVTSTAVGAALTGAPTALLIGDVAFLHDTNGLLGLAARGVNLVMVVIDNDGGGIFSFLPQHDLLQRERFEQLFGTPHGVDLVALAGVHAIPAERVSSRAGMRASVAGALTRGGPRVVVVETDRESNLAVHTEISELVAEAWTQHSVAQ